MTKGIHNHILAMAVILFSGKMEKQNKKRKIKNKIANKIYKTQFTNP